MRKIKTQSQSYKRNLVYLKKSKLVLNLLTDCNLNLDLTTVLLQSELRKCTTKKFKFKFVFFKTKFLFIGLPPNAKEVNFALKETFLITTILVKLFYKLHFKMRHKTIWNHSLFVIFLCFLKDWLQDNFKKN